MVLGMGSVQRVGSGCVSGRGDGSKNEHDRGDDGRRHDAVGVVVVVFVAAPAGSLCRRRGRRW